jgi:hypothetical protein
MEQVKIMLGRQARGMCSTLALFATLLPGALPDAVAADHWVRGAITLLADGSGILSRSVNEDAYATDTATVSGGVGQASALYVVTLVSASISAQAGAALDPADLAANVAAAQVNDASFQDKLTFSIPAGSYPSGLQGIARGLVQASAQADAEGARVRRARTIRSSWQCRRRTGEHKASRPTRASTPTKPRG